MENKAPVNLEELQRTFLECNVCFELFNEEDRHPRLLPCLHTFCNKCLEALQKEGKIICPQCKSTHTLFENGLERFPKDNTRRDLLDFVKASSNQKSLICEMCVDDQKATHRCKQCEHFICEDCVEIHEKVVDMKSHDIFALQDLSDDSLEVHIEKFTHKSFCKDKNHDKEVLKMYCSSFSCQKPVCTLCAFTTHKGHEISTINEAFEEERKKLTSASAKVNDKVSDMEKIMVRVQKEIADLPQTVEEQKETIQAIFGNAREILRRKEEKLCKEIGVKKSEKLQILEKQRSELEILKDSCAESCFFLENSLKFENKAAFLELWPTIESRMTRLKSASFDKNPRTKAFTFKATEGQNMLLDLQNVVDNLGKVVNSEVYLPNCSVNAPTRCYVGDNICFEIFLRTLNKSLIVDENVELIIKQDREELLRIKCFFVDVEYKCNWSPESEAIYTYHITSNGMVMQFENNTITVQKK